MYRCRYTMYTSINLLKIMHHCRYALHNPSRDTYLPLELHHHTKRINLKWILLFCFHVKPQLAPRIKFSSLNETAATLTMYDLINYKYISSHPIIPVVWIQIHYISIRILKFAHLDPDHSHFTRFHYNFGKNL